MIVGMFSRPAAISWPGVVLSHEARQTIPSSSAPSTATSMSDAIRSRLGRMYCPAAPADVIASDGAAVRTSNATPPAALIASLSGPTIWSRWLKQEASWEEELTMAIFGFSRSASVSPSAVHCARRIAHGVDPGVKLERSAFEPGDFEPGVFEPGVFEPGAFEPGAFEPGAFEPCVIAP